MIPVLVILVTCVSLLGKMGWLLLVLATAIVVTKTDDTLEKLSDDGLSDEQGTGRLMLWRKLPQYQDVDMAANFNKLKSSGDAAFFVVRDTIVVR